LACCFCQSLEGIHDNGKTEWGKSKVESGVGVNAPKRRKRLESLQRATYPWPVLSYDKVCGIGKEMVIFICLHVLTFDELITVIGGEPVTRPNQLFEIEGL